MRFCPSSYSEYIPYLLISTAAGRRKRKNNGKILKIGMFTHSLGMSTEIIRISHQIKKCIHRFTAGAPTGCKSLRVKKNICGKFENTFWVR